MIILDTQANDLETFSDIITRAIVGTIAANEVSNLDRYIYGFSDADGWNQNRSGTTFGRTQFDMNTNFQTARGILKEIGFTDQEIQVLRTQSSVEMIKRLELKLKTKEARAIIDHYDFEHFSILARYAKDFLKAANVRYVTLNGLVAIADFHNQIGSSIGSGALFNWVKNNSQNNQVIDHSTILFLKFTIKWGKKRPDDVIRRSINLDSVCSTLAREITTRKYMTIKNGETASSVLFNSETLDDTGLSNGSMYSGLTSSDSVSSSSN